MTDPKTTITSPDSLIDDENSWAFYILKNESVALCKTESELSYSTNRATYLSSGRFSPKFKTVIFWPDPINPKRGLDLLVESGHIDTTYTWQVSGAATMSKMSKTPLRSGKVDNLETLRKCEVNNLLNSGMKVQGKVQGKLSNLPKDNE